MKFLSIVLACLLSVGLVESLFENFLGGNEVQNEIDLNQIVQDDILNEEIASKMIFHIYTCSNID
jgi:hypothetical protein